MTVEHGDAEGGFKIQQSPIEQNIPHYFTRITQTLLCWYERHTAKSSTVVSKRPCVDSSALCICLEVMRLLSTGSNLDE